MGSLSPSYLILCLKLTLSVSPSSSLPLGPQEFYASVLDVLTPDDVRVLVEMEDEFSRRGQFERIFPSRIASRYLRFFDQPRYFNILTTQWEQKYHGNKLKGDASSLPEGGHVS